MRINFHDCGGSNVSLANEQLNKGPGRGNMAVDAVYSLSKRFNLRKTFPVHYNVMTIVCSIHTCRKKFTNLHCNNFFLYVLLGIFCLFGAQLSSESGRQSSSEHASLSSSEPECPSSSEPERPSSYDLIRLSNSEPEGSSSSELDDLSSSEQSRLSSSGQEHMFNSEPERLPSSELDRKTGSELEIPTSSEMESPADQGLVNNTRQRTSRFHEVQRMTRAVERLCASYAGSRNVPRITSLRTCAWDSEQYHLVPGPKWLGRRIWRHIGWTLRLASHFHTL
jgi:hypothetical protein